MLSNVRIHKAGRDLACVGPVPTIACGSTSHGMEWNQGRETGPGLPSVWLATRASASSCDPRALTPMSARQRPASKLQLLDLRLEAQSDSHSLHDVIYGVLRGYTTRTDGHLVRP